MAFLTEKTKPHGVGKGSTELLEAPNCGGWGLMKWGFDHWGTGKTGTGPVLIGIEPACGSVDVPVCTPIKIVITAGDCSPLSSSCTSITLNGVEVYSSGSWTSDCSSGSSITESVHDVFGTIWTIIIDCGCFECGQTITFSATFCDEDGNNLVIDKCSFQTIKCFTISKVEIVDHKHYAIHFNNALLTDINANPALYDPNSYSCTPVNSGLIPGDPIKVKTVLVDAGMLPTVIILEVESTTNGAAYEFTGSRDIKDVHRQRLSNFGNGVIFSRFTKLDEMTAKLPRVYNRMVSAPGGKNYLSPYHLFAVLGIEDERIGGDF